MKELAPERGSEFLPENIAIAIAFRMNEAQASATFSCRRCTGTSKGEDVALLESVLAESRIVNQDKYNPEAAAARTRLKLVTSTLTLVGAVLWSEKFGLARGVHAGNKSLFGYRLNNKDLPILIVRLWFPG
ncbi:hypothetical protein R1sor_001312 [Riccia sorocarpa]|uniref:Uncharacterized protein n=1 Tax=Riccia sorocarpa TaxID=122646 RepID=A0ABD3GYW1_9MARC